MNMKTAGIIGGVGPETTAEFYLEIIFGCYKKNKEQRPPILIWNTPLKYEMESDLLQKSSGEERYIPYLIEAAQKLEKSGADFLVMPCNSLHIFIEQIRQAVKIPVLSIVEETVDFLKKSKINKVGVIATSTSIKRRLYAEALEKEGIELVVPDDFEQAKMGNVIKNIILNRHANRDREEIIKIINNFEKKKVKNIILACTDLQLLIPHHPVLKIYDTMKIFAEATVNTILEKDD
ncbi:amino acid racemase [Candidatus Woesearchaeota archaeon]|nr:amino acid racemase [Candidatus Woesearchaeota archaeon]